MPTTTSSPTNSARTVAGLMGWAVLFSLVGNEVKVTEQKTQSNATASATNGAQLGTGARIIIGGFVAAGLLVALTGAGEAGRKFAVGISVVTAVSATLVYGGPVWSTLQNVFSNTGTKGTGGTTPTGNTAQTGATSPTHGFATAAALAQAA